MLIPFFVQKYRLLFALSKINSFLNSMKLVYILKLHKMSEKFLLELGQKTKILDFEVHTYVIDRIPSCPMILQNHCNVENGLRNPKKY